ncbi:hypothetical protein [Streptomyces chattanoogensis]|uniref:hypothetical protein n=1 Tax=Streptomyces chattanoogensis TaxID=66876 RepID=UPI0006B582D9|nr:hypothetical protein [Streptomyces chattanoogensis]
MEIAPDLGCTVQDATPIDTWEEFTAPEQHGTRVTFDLDPSYIGRGEAVAWALCPWETLPEYCAVRSSPTAFPIRDVRAEAEGAIPLPAA